ncbi:MAG: carbamoyltransferase HypF, partial [Calditrichia bacterium]
GLGGFHLMVDASDEGALRKLRKRKQRKEKPFALMYPSLEQVESHCEVSPQEQRLLLSAASPIVLLKKKNTAKETIVSSIAPGNPYLGIMLPYTPLHHLLMRELGIAVVATSGNLSDEPICIDEQEALQRLGGIADVFLVHNRPIIRHVDDSIVRLLAGREMILRRARGFAPLPLPLQEKSHPILAVGAHLKNSVALSVENQVFISQHIGDLETDAAFRAFEDVIESLKKLYDTEPACVACDAHPDYLSTQFANRLNIPKQAVQHHLAHVLGCMLENKLSPPLLGVSWDGTGYGLDGSVWGGEFFLIEADRSRRIGRLREFPLPGGDNAVKEPRRAALGLLFEIGGNTPEERSFIAQWQPFSEKEISLLGTMLQKKINSPLTSSAGRLFDAVASLCGIRHINRFEGQAAMELEFQIDGKMLTDEKYQFRLITEGSGKERCYIFDWEPMIRELLEDIRKKLPVETISTKFHNTLTSVIVEMAIKLNTSKIVLSGGCFQNKFLSETTIHALRRNGFQVYWHQRVPPNDGGISLGQIAAAIQKNDFFKL